MEKDYFLGLDIGTGSVGWAVTDEYYEIIRKHGKALWGVRLFETALTAEERRLFRTSRRRLNRRNWRLEILQGLFDEEIQKVDPGFYLRMKESRYVPEDKRDLEGNCPELPYALFVDRKYTDKDYHKQFPTIYHLRKWLMETNETPDIRLVYLAIHHIMKHRGHFLLSGNIDSIKDFRATFAQFDKGVKEEELDYHLEYENDDLICIENILKNSRITRTAKSSQLCKQLNAKTECEKALLNLIAGRTVKLSAIFGEPEMDNYERPKIAFTDSNYDEYAPSIEADLGEQYIIIQRAKAVYDWALLVDILGDYHSISESKVATYEKHKEDLQYLKKLVNEKLGRDVYRNVFVKTNDKLANYPAYIGMTKVNGKKVSLEGKQCTKKDFYDFLKKNVLNVIGDEEEAAYLREEIENETFLPKQVTKDNSVLPYQIHQYELNKILDNLRSRVPMLAENETKIQKTFVFRVPYYVGPLNGIKKGDATTNWVVRAPEKVYPWNFVEMIDEEASAERFIRRMTNKCTYLVHADVLPKNSLLYSKFMVLNELNNLRLNGEPIDVALKQAIYENVFQRNRKVSQKKLKDYLVREGIVDRSVEITGIDGDFKSTLTSYHDMKEKLTGAALSQRDQERIITDITLFGEDKGLLKRRLKTQYPVLTEGQIKGLCTLSYSGWGRLSREFLEDITAPDPETGEVWNIIRAMWETNDNLMQILSAKYLFAQNLEEANVSDEIQGITYKLVEQAQVSPAVKRQMWQTLLIVKELCKVMKQPPKRLFIEMAREKAESKRTDSRKKTLIELYRKCHDEEREWIAELEHTDDHKLRGDKLFLYYIQKGRCMYSGDVIPLEELWDNNKYDIDHIYPQSKVMDDSLDNRVLVKRTYNADKTDIYPIAEDIRRKMRPFWHSLLEGGFISKEKYHRLTRSDEFSPNELAGFIERQLVETRQGTKAVASILKQVLPDTEIVYVKAKNVSQFRQEFDLIKVREMNDYHHAKDAYLNVVVGNTYHVKFTKSAANYICENPGRTYNLKKMFVLADVVRNGEVAWRVGGEGSIRIVRKVMDRNNILVTRRSYQVKGGLFDQQLMKKGKGQIPVKSSDERLCDIEKYGGYNKATGTYFMLVESENKKGKRIRTIEYVPLLAKRSVEENEQEALAMLRERGLVNPRILMPCIKIDTLFKVDGFYMWLSGRTMDRLIFKGANQLVLPKEDAMLLKKVLQYVERQKENRNVKIGERDGLSAEILVNLYDVFLEKIQNTIYGVRLGAQEKTLTEKREKFISLSDENKCIVLSEILHMFQCQSGAADLRLIDGPGKAGILVMNQEITNCKQISIINQSPTGIYEQEIDLKKL